MKTMVSLLVILLDQASKWLVMARMFPNQSIPLIANRLHLTYVQNPGAAFGILAGRIEFFVLVTSLAVVMMLYYLWKLPPSEWRIRWGILLGLGGAVGNLIDRVRFGYVVDFMDLRFWPVFNIADMAIVTGVFLLAYGILRGGWEEVSDEE